MTKSIWRLSGFAQVRIFPEELQRIALPYNLSNQKQETQKIVGRSINLSMSTFPKQSAPHDNMFPFDHPGRHFIHILRLRDHNDMLAIQLGMSPTNIKTTAIDRYWDTLPAPTSLRNLNRRIKEIQHTSTVLLTTQQYRANNTQQGPMNDNSDRDGTNCLATLKKDRCLNPDVGLPMFAT